MGFELGSGLGIGADYRPADGLRFFHSSGDRAAFCTTFSPYDFEERGFRARVIRQLNQDFADGSVAVKIYKVTGWR